VSGRVLVVGSCSLDLTLRVERLPEPGETVLAGPTLSGFGGKGANQAVAAARAGALVTMVGRVGDEALGAAYRDRLAGFGVDVQHLRTTPGVPTGTAYVMVDADGGNAIVVDLGANATVQPADLEPVSGLGPGDVLLVQCELSRSVVAEAVHRAHAAGARVVLNLAPSTTLPPEVVARADPLVVNEEEARWMAAFDPVLTGRLGRPAGGPVSLLVTRGPAGATWDDLDHPAVTVPRDQVVDTTGAGDAFCGALAAALAAGSDRLAALDLALAAGADAVRRVGAQPPG
jgi:ribokinase